MRVRLIIDGYKFDLLTYSNYFFKPDPHDMKFMGIPEKIGKGKKYIDNYLPAYIPTKEAYGGIFKITFEAKGEEEFLEWAISGKAEDKIKLFNGILEFRNYDNEEVVYSIEFWDAFIHKYKLVHDTLSSQPLMLEVSISAATLRYNYSLVNQKNWFITEINSPEFKLYTRESEEEEEEKEEEKGTVVVISGTDKKQVKDYRTSDKWIMYKTSVYHNIILKTYKKLKKTGQLPEPNYITYLCRDAHQLTSYNKTTKKTTYHKRSEKRYGTNGETPPGEYFLKLGIKNQKYAVYIVDSESKSADSGNGIEGIHGARGGIAIHHFSPRYSIGCLTMNEPVVNEIQLNGRASGTKVKELLDNIPDLKIKTNPVHLILEEREVKETIWEDPRNGTKKWTGI